MLNVVLTVNVMLGSLIGSAMSMREVLTLRPSSEKFRESAPRPSELLMLSATMAKRTRKKPGLELDILPPFRKEVALEKFGTLVSLPSVVVPFTKKMTDVSSVNIMSVLRLTLRSVFTAPTDRGAASVATAGLVVGWVTRRAGRSGRGVVVGRGVGDGVHRNRRAGVVRGVIARAVRVRVAGRVRVVGRGAAGRGMAARGVVGVVSPGSGMVVAGTRGVGVTRGVEDSTALLLDLGVVGVRGVVAAARASGELYEV